MTVETVGSGISLTFGIMTARSLREEEEKRIDAWKGTIDGFGPGGRAEEEAIISGCCFDEPADDPFGSIKKEGDEWRRIAFHLNL